MTGGLIPQPPPVVKSGAFELWVALGWLLIHKNFDKQNWREFKTKMNH